MEDTTLYLSSAVVAFLILYVVANWWTRYQLPPGPWGLPLLGSAPFMGKRPYETFLKLSKKYGPVFTIRLGRRDVVVLSDYKSINEAFVRRGDVFNHRADDTLMRVALQGKGIIDSVGSLWKEHRRYSLRVLRDFGFGKNGIEEVIMREADELLERLETVKDQPIDLRGDLCRTIVNVIWSVVSGERFKWSDPRLEDMLETLGANATPTGNATGILKAFPWLRFILPIGRKSVAELQEKRKAFFQEAIDHHKEGGKDSGADDLISQYLVMQKRQIEENGSTTFDDGQTVAVILDLFVAGMETVVSTLRWTFLLLMKYPDVQKLVQEEIDEIIGKWRAPKFEDRLQEDVPVSGSPSQGWKSF